jgi:RNA methyltransferase, TrmH family
MVDPLGPTNPRIQRLRRLLGRRSSRVDEGAFVVEGPTLVAELLVSGWPVEDVYVETSALSLVPAGVRAIECRDGTLAKVMDVETARPLLAVAKRVVASSLPVGATFVLVAGGVGDPGNLGTMLRIAEASGAAAVVLTSGSVDPFAPKTVRAAAGSLFRVPVLVDFALDSLGLPLYGTTMTGGVQYDQADLRSPVALVLGNEAHGLPPDLNVAHWLSIPHVGRAESLNVAMAAAVLCFEVARQRRG